ncbi:phage tail protein [Herbaspirillum sp. YR522]|uniref:phage tail protein n=1 Tax=Herbaspirillum sp. YR522 TaxID=1144342 RepID=UPI00026F7F88|nr:tail fiber protein [Herbaspirillum sp. YR522]EJN03234.1 microcystin-dependent protein [Herbaspirillum sp. YR522]
MNNKIRGNKLASLTLVAGLGLAAMSPAAIACSGDSPVLASVCIMAVPATFGSFNRTYMLAAGQQMSINQSTALYSLIGITYGGNASTTFNLPDLRGKVVIGATLPNDTTIPQVYPAGTTGGNATIKLAVAQLPPHVVTIAALPVNLTGVTATTTLASLAATADLSGVVITGPASGLTVGASSTASGLTSPSGNYLGKSNGTAGNIYSSATPDVTLNAATIGGKLSVTVDKGIGAPVTVSGTATTTIGGTATASGASAVIGAGMEVPTMPPYLALTYYIAAQNALYPSRD